MLAFIESLQLSRAVWLSTLAALLYLLPGGVLIACLGRGRWQIGSTLVERTILAAGLSVAFNALLVYATLSGLRLGAAAALGFLVLCGVGILVRWALNLGARRRRLGSWPEVWRAARRRIMYLLAANLWRTRHLPHIALVLVTALVLGVRLYAVRDVAVPMWGDSYQHTMIAQLIVDNGGLFDSWEPYAPLQTFTYHFGFHANVALFHWLSLLDGGGLPVYRLVIWVGQILNVLAVLTLYPLALKVSGSRWAGVVAVWVAGLFLPMPMYYVNWGRYTQLAGQAILPVAVLLSWGLLEAPVDRRSQGALLQTTSSFPRGRWGAVGHWALAWIAVSGLALTHYRVLIFYGAFVLAWLLLKLVRDRRSAGWPARWHALRRAIGLGAVPFLVVLPWVVRTLGSKFAQTVARQVTSTPGRISSFSAQYNAIGDLNSFMGPLGWLLLAAAAASGLWRRRRGSLVVSTWWFLLFVGTNPQMLGLPGSGVITNFALFIAIYIPAGILIGEWAGSWIDRAGARTWVHVLLVLVVIGGGLYGADLRISDVRVGQHALALQPDVEAMAWIRENTPAGARFLVNSFFAYGGALVVGSDGGWWLPLLAGRANTVPPLTYGSEQGPWPEYRLWVNEMTRQVEERGVTDPATVELLRERGITHVYIGQQQGHVNYAGPHALVARELLDSPHFRAILHQDEVWVFEVVADTGQE